MLQKRSLCLLLLLGSQSLVLSSDDQEKKPQSYRDRIKTYFSNRDNLTHFAVFGGIALFLLYKLQSDIKSEHRQFKQGMGASEDLGNPNKHIQDSYRLDEQYTAALALLGSISSQADCFGILGLDAKTTIAQGKAGATAVIKRQFRNLSRNLHPDKNSNTAASELATRMLNEAYGKCQREIDART